MADRTFDAAETLTAFRESGHWWRSVVGGVDDHPAGDGALIERNLVVAAHRSVAGMGGPEADAFCRRISRRPLRHEVVQADLMVALVRQHGGDEVELLPPAA